ncbi:MAG: hypothetical protein IT340_11590, partial [Chloroflexi bacterium]|nr:hypothetical protein [Chloroflexota bacterium]
TGIDGGHDVMGAAGPRTDWYFAEGYTGTGFDEYLTINNPGAVDGSVTILYFVEGLAPALQPQRVVPLPKNSRVTVVVHGAFAPVGNPGGLGRLTAGHATRLISTVPVIVERPMYFTYNGSLDGGHNVMGYAP